MRKLVFMLIAVLCLSMTAMADQLEYVSEQDAQNAVKLLKKQKYVLLYQEVWTQVVQDVLWR